MRESKIENNSYLGSWKHLCQVFGGDIPIVIFHAYDAGLFYFSNGKRNDKKNDCKIDEIIFKKYTKMLRIEQIRKKSNYKQVYCTL